jgi:BolA protein
VTDRVREIERRLRAALTLERIEIVDESRQHAGHAGARGGGGHFAVTLVSPQFAGLNPIQRHQLVYAALGDLMQREIHALSLRVFTPEEF